MREIIHTCPKRIHYDKFLFFMLKGRRLQVSGFTLVELIVVITILAILGTIAFISLQGYSANSRDSVRSSDMGAIKVSLELYQLASGNYPNTTGGNIITFSGSEAWKQGTFGNDTFKNIDKMDDIPVDPLTGREYTYSVTNRKNEYQLAGIMEGDEYVYNNPLIPLPREIVSAAGNKTALLKVIGNYNGQMLRVVQGNTTYILAVPSIITSTGGTLTDIITNGYLAFNGYKNLPLDYKGSTYNELGEGTMDLVKVADLVVYSGSIDEIQSQDGVGRKIMLTNLQKAYSGTLLENNEGIKILTNINSLTDKKREELGCILSNNNLGAKLFIKDCKKTISGNFFIKGLQTNSSGESYGDTISYDSSGNIYITGLFKGTGIKPGSAIFSLSLKRYITT